ncbi:MAG: carboxymuconolactone decarboxylase family protein [Spirochaetes bacterium]|nr:carboxymuconolactone decarboxylase family protein [Spirochaetota bacterium]
MSKIKEFIERRKILNKLVLENGTIVTKRFFNLDSNSYEEGAIPSKYKELMGLVGSLILRCNDCIMYHCIQAKKLGVEDKEFYEACDIALIIGGSIVIPHLREAYSYWEELKGLNKDELL